MEYWIFDPELKSIEVINYGKLDKGKSTIYQSGRIKSKIIELKDLKFT